MNRETADLSKQKRNYPLLLASQFLSAFGDNLILMIILGPFLIERNKGMITEQQQSIANVEDEDEQFHCATLVLG